MIFRKVGNETIELVKADMNKNKEKLVFLHLVIFISRIFSDLKRL
jgi:phosphoribosyl-ATP pyrophosphohydrolase